MNRVVSIELARQMFWIDESAYKVLQSYIQKLQTQLTNDENGEEILKDIELRIAELFYELGGEKNKAITSNQVENVIEQVGWLDTEESELEPVAEGNQPRKGYRDPNHKIIAGVCSGLANRLGVPAFLLRLVFLGLATLFGLGVVLYLIFWISLDASDNRNAALASQGKAQTARHIADYQAPKASVFMQIQRILFLPLSIAGALLSVFANHIKRRQSVYALLLKVALTGILLILTMIIVSMLFEFNKSALFNRPVSWLLSMAVIFLVALAITLFVRKFYFVKPPMTNWSKINNRLKYGATAASLFIASAILYLNHAQSEFQTKRVDKQFALGTQALNLKYLHHHQHDEYSGNVGIELVTDPALSQTVQLQITYSGYGIDADDAKENLKSAAYFYTFNNGTLELNDFWTLLPNTYNRGQDVEVSIRIPAGIEFTSSKALVVDSESLETDEYSYRVDNGYYSSEKQKSYRYMSHAPYLHEIGEQVANKLSENERDILNDRFCDEFFISESWACYSNIRNPISQNNRFDRAFSADSDKIEQIREFLLPDRSFFVANLQEINSLIGELTIKYPVKSEFQQYIEHLLTIKSALGQTGSG